MHARIFMCVHIYRKKCERCQRVGSKCYIQIYIYAYVYVYIHIHTCTHMCVYICIQIGICKAPTCRLPKKLILRVFGKRALYEYGSFSKTPSNLGRL